MQGRCEKKSALISGHVGNYVAINLGVIIVVVVFQGNVGGNYFRKYRSIHSEQDETKNRNLQYIVFQETEIKKSSCNYNQLESYRQIKSKSQILILIVFL